MTFKEKCKLKLLDLREWYNELSDLSKVQVTATTIIVTASLLSTLHNAILNQKRYRLSALENQTLRRNSR